MLLSISQHHVFQKQTSEHTADRTVLRKTHPEDHTQLYQFSVYTLSVGPTLKSRHTSTTTSSVYTLSVRPTLKTTHTALPVQCLHALRRTHPEEQTHTSISSVCTWSGKPICTPAHLSKVSSMLPLKWLHGWSVIL